MFRAMRGYSQDYVAEKIGMSTGNFGKIERGDIDVNATHLMEIARTLDVTVSDLFNESNLSKEKPDPYGYATKDELRQLSDTMLLILNEINFIKKQLPTGKKATKNNRSKSSKA